MGAVFGNPLLGYLCDAYCTCMISSCSLSVPPGAGMDESKAAQIMSQLQRLQISYMGVESAPCVGAISKLSGQVVYRNPHIACLASDLFSVSKELLMLQNSPSLDHQNAVRRLVCVLDNPDIAPQLTEYIQSSCYESKQFIGIAALLLKPLCAKFTVNSVHYPKLLEDVDLPNPPATEVMGVGTINTWYGIPDGRSDGTPVVVQHQRESESSDSDSSVGGKAVVEGKKTMRPAQMYDQILGYVVVHSFVCASKHPQKHALVPAVSFAAETGDCCVALYDCQHDILLLMDAMTWVDIDSEAPTLNDFTIVVVWLLLNQHLFLKPLSAQRNNCKSGLHNLFNQGNTLAHYKSLKNFHVATWMQRNVPPTHATRDRELVKPCATGATP